MSLWERVFKTSAGRVTISVDAGYAEMTPLGEDGEPSGEPDDWPVDELADGLFYSIGIPREEAEALASEVQRALVTGDTE